MRSRASDSAGGLEERRRKDIGRRFTALRAGLALKCSRRPRAYCPEDVLEKLLYLSYPRNQQAPTGVEESPASFVILRSMFGAGRSGDRKDLAVLIWQGLQGGDNAWYKLDPTSTQTKELSSQAWVSALVSEMMWTPSMTGDSAVHRPQWVLHGLHGSADLLAHVLLGHVIYSCLCADCTALHCCCCCCCCNTAQRPFNLALQA